MEDSQQTQQSRRPPQLTPEKFPALESRLPRQHCHTAQVLYAKDMQKNYSPWKRWAVNNLYLPVFRFLHKHWNIAPPTGRDAEGREIWVAHQGCFLTRAEADMDAARYPHGYVVPNVPLGRSLTADVAEETSIYVPNKDRPEKVDLAPLQEEVRMLGGAVKALRAI